MTTITVNREEHEAFRNELASIARDGRRRWIYARQPSGRLYRARTAVGVVLLAFLFGAPFVRVGGQPLMLLNILERRFVLFGVLFRPQDFHIVVLFALTMMVTVVLSTVVFGRIWCGWLCPQTVFLEMLFRRLEYLIAGSAEQQLRRDRGRWTADRMIRTTVKHGVFFALSFVIANVFLAWIIGAEALGAIVTDPPSLHLAGLSAILVFSLVFYLVFARFREQACVLACPYGRMLSALTDRHTITVTYDWRRGEPRGRLARSVEAEKDSRGDCIDCHQCVTVCPTGIDIRHGIQLECVNCTACIDACNGVMSRIGKPAGLIRLTSDDAVRGATASWKTPRAAAYAAIWLVLAGTLSVLASRMRDLDVLILRQPGTLYTTLANGDVANFYSVEALNRTRSRATFAIEVVEPRQAVVTALGPLGDVQPFAVAEGRLLVQLGPSAIAGGSTPIRFAIRTADGSVQLVDSAFLGPQAP
jgi:cytochrome c oxidase accessory protein FixG